MPMEVIRLVRTIQLNPKFRKVALRRRPYIPENDNETDVIAYVVPSETKTVKRLDDEIYYDYTDDEYYRVALPDERTGFMNRLAFMEVDNNG